MENRTFMDWVGVHYDKIRSLFKSRSHNANNDFDEDAFNDAFIKCAQRFGNTATTYEDVVKYFWIAYINTIKSSSHDKFDEFNIELHDCIDDTDDDHASYIYNIVMDAITEAFGEDDMMIYSLYKYHGWKKIDLINAGYDCSNLDIRIKTIHRFVKAYCKKKFK